MDIEHKIKWLQKNYRNYPRSWYEENIKRTLAIYETINSRYVNDVMDNLTREREDAIKRQITLCEKSYLNQYGTSMNDDEMLHGRKYVIDRVTNLIDKSYKSIIIP